MILLALAAGRATGQPQTKDQRKCTGAMNEALRLIASRAGKSAAACIKDGSKEELDGTVEACLTADRGGKVGEAVADGAATFDKRCTGTSKNDPASPKRPPYGVTDPPTVQAAALEMNLSILHDLFGSDLDAAIVREAIDQEAAKCQRSVGKRAGKCAGAMLKAFNDCKGRGLKDKLAPFDGPDDLAACLGADPKNKIAKLCDLQGGGTVDGIRKALDKKCPAKQVDLAAALPGCGLDDPEQSHACIAAAVQCRVCLALDRADGLARDCDLFDDGAANASCTARLVIGEHQCVLSSDGGFVFETNMFFDLFTLGGAVDLDCGTVDPMTGKASCTCALDHIDPIPIIPGLGVACVRPASGCPAGEISCNGGELYNSSITSQHNIGTCTGNADCAAQCATDCVGSGSSVFDSGCEGFCRGGASAGASCTADAGCPGGTCNGLDGATHGNICQCECLDTAGDGSLPGGLHCSLGVAVDVEMAEPCGDGDGRFRTVDRCVPFTTEAAQAVIVDADNVPGEEIPPGQDIYGGLPLTCTELAANGASGLVLAARVNVLDVQLAGDIAFAFVLACD